jgi:hypothetical protein
VIEEILDAPVRLLRVGVACDKVHTVDGNGWSFPPLSECRGSEAIDVLRYGKGDHDMWHNPVTGQKVTVPVNLKSRHTANDILKDAGLPKIG